MTICWVQAPFTDGAPPPSLSANTGKCLLKANWLKAAMLFKKNPISVRNPLIDWHHSG